MALARKFANFVKAFPGELFALQPLYLLRFRLFNFGHSRSAWLERWP